MAHTRRVRLRRGWPKDAARMAQQFTDSRVRRHLGGSRPRVVAWGLTVATLAATGHRAGRWAYVVADPRTDRMLGTVLVDRRRPDRPGHLAGMANELELSYALLPDAWGQGLAHEAVGLLLERLARDGIRGDEPVLVVTQSANAPALQLALRLGFTPHDTFSEYGDDQTLLIARLDDLLDQARSAGPSSSLA